VIRGKVECDLGLRAEAGDELIALGADIFQGTVGHFKAVKEETRRGDLIEEGG
jgi:hypothetical protein